MLIAYSSPAVMKVRYCTALRGSWFLPELEAWFEAWLGAWFDTPIISLLTSLPRTGKAISGFPGGLCVLGGESFASTKPNGSA
jgi:hypothetical protein